MFDIGFLELILIGIVGLLVLGPERLPTAARTVGLWVGRARRMVGEVTREIDRQLKTEELRDRLSKEGDELGLEKIQKTVDDALLDAKNFRNMVNKPAKTALGSIMPSDKSMPNAGEHNTTEDKPSTEPQQNSDNKPTQSQNIHQSQHPEP